MHIAVSFRIVLVGQLSPSSNASSYAAEPPDNPHSPRHTRSHHAELPITSNNDVRSATRPARMRLGIRTLAPSKRRCNAGHEPRVAPRTLSCAGKWPLARPSGRFFLQNRQLGMVFARVTRHAPETAAAGASISAAPGSSATGLLAARRAA